MAKELANGDQHTITRPPPIPSPLRFSKFFQVIFLFFLKYFTGINNLFFHVYDHLFLFVIMCKGYIGHHSELIITSVDVW